MARGLVASLLLAGAAALVVPQPPTGSKAPPPVFAPEGFVAPEPRPLTVTGDWSTTIVSSLALLLRLGAGITVHGWQPKLSLAAPQAGAYALKLGPLYISDDSASLRGELKRPKGHLTLYEFDSSPFCRKVRDALTALDLEVDCRPCPGAVAGFSDELFERTGRRTVPYLVDADAGIELFESEAIVDYLYDAYGPGREKTPFFLRGNVALVSAGLAGTVRLLPAAALQVDARLDNIGRQPLSLYGYETSPFVRPVREKLCSLALPHTVVNAARGSVKREELIGRTGKPFQVPYLVDPNTGVELFESVAIRIYLDRVYTTSGYTPLEDAPPQVKTE